MNHSKWNPDQSWTPQTNILDNKEKEKVKLKGMSRTTQLRQTSVGGESNHKSRSKRQGEYKFWKSSHNLSHQPIYLKLPMSSTLVLLLFQNN